MIFLGILICTLTWSACIGVPVSNVYAVQYADPAFDGSLDQSSFLPKRAVRDFDDFYYRPGFESRPSFGGPNFRPPGAHIPTGDVPIFGPPGGSIPTNEYPTFGPPPGGSNNGPTGTPPFQPPGVSNNSGNGVPSLQPPGDSNNGQNGVPSFQPPGDSNNGQNGEPPFQPSGGSNGQNGVPSFGPPGGFPPNGRPHYRPPPHMNPRSGQWPYYDQSSFDYGFDGSRFRPARQTNFNTDPAFDPFAYDRGQVGPNFDSGFDGRRLAPGGGYRPNYEFAEPSYY